MGAMLPRGGDPKRLNLGENGLNFVDYGLYLWLWGCFLRGNGQNVLKRGLKL